MQRTGGRLEASLTGTVVEWSFAVTRRCAMQISNRARTLYATLPAADMDRADRWYRDTLGATPVMEEQAGTVYQVGDARFLVYPSQYAGTNEATAATLIVDDVAGTADELRQAGVQLEQFDAPDMEWRDGVGTMHVGDREMHGIWFRDSEGNILGATDYSVE
jgi:catechol 2,3-dioxygenase-like lactoylglutathione lyase family enzyme